MSARVSGSSKVNPTRLTTLQRWLRARPAMEVVAVILEALRDHDPAERLELLAEDNPTFAISDAAGAAG